MNGLVQDLRYGIRMFAANPGLFLIAVFTLALGIAGNTAVFSFANAYLLRVLPFKEPGRLVHLWETNRRESFDRSRVSLPNFLDWKEQSRSFSELAVFNYTEENLTGAEEPERIPVGRVSANIFDLLGVKAALGRTFRSGEDLPGRGSVIILSHQCWQRRFGGDPAVLGKTVKLDGESYSVVGIMPPDFRFPLPTTQMWAPRILDVSRWGRDRRFLQVAGRLKPGVSIQQAQAEMNTLAARLEAEYPKENADAGVNVVPLQQALNFAYEILHPMSVLLGFAVGFVLLICCANVANLLLSRGVARAREVAVRSALGAGRLRLIRQFLSESALMSLIGGVLGTVLAFWLLDSIKALIPDEIYRVGEVTVDAQALMFTLALCLLTTVIFGLAPAWQVSGSNLNVMLREGAGGSGTGPRRQRLQSILVVAEIGLSVILFAGAALMVQSFLQLRRVDLGFNSRSVLTMKLVLRGPQYAEAPQVLSFHRKLLDEVRRLPGVVSAATVDYLPLNHEREWMEIDSAEAPADPSVKPLLADSLYVSPGYFRVMEVPILRGRAFAAQDNEAAPPSVIINDKLARRLFPRGNPVGGMLFVTDRQGEKTPYRVLGVAGNARHWSLDEDWPALVYFGEAQNPQRYMRLIVRTAADPLAATSAVRQAVRTVDPGLPVTEVRSLQQVVDEYLVPQQSMAGSLMVLGFAALLLATIGIYGVMAYFVSQRTQEIGIRMALGATRKDVLRIVLRKGITLTLLGGGLGVAAALAVSRRLGSLLYGVNPADPSTFGGISLLLIIVAVTAAYVPARRAARVELVHALRHE